MRSPLALEEERAVMSTCSTPIRSALASLRREEGHCWVDSKLCYERPMERRTHSTVKKEIVQPKETMKPDCQRGTPVAGPCHPESGPETMFSISPLRTQSDRPLPQ